MLQTSIAQAAQCIALSVSTARLNLGFGEFFAGVLFCILRVQQATLFYCKQEDQAIHQPQQLLEVVVLAEFTIGQLLAQSLVSWVLNKAFAQC